MAYQHEARIQENLAGFMRMQYPSVIFRSDFAAGIKMTMGQAIKHKKMQGGRGYPDFFVAYPSRGYHGCFLELKEPGAAHLPYLKDGTISREKSIQRQAEVLYTLHQLGYYARFAVGFEQARAIIDWYMDTGSVIVEPSRDNGSEVVGTRAVRTAEKRAKRAYPKSDMF